MKKQIYFLFLVLNLVLSAYGEMVFVPGEVNSLCNYDNFFYSLPEHDFLFYFNQDKKPGKVYRPHHQGIL
ncbi:MAG: hypothetical protein IH584_06855, partial [Candidatus Aminicenantes bacterium]|nr:hypothetical protein [Candidatus Aminicenantes bacterium]